MKCVACGKDLEFGYGCECYCKNKACEYYYNTPHGMNSFGAQGEQWQARAEKAELLSINIWWGFKELCPDHYLGGCLKKSTEMCNNKDCGYSTCPIVVRAKEDK